MPQSTSPRKFPAMCPDIFPYASAETSIISYTYRF